MKWYAAAILVLLVAWSFQLALLAYAMYTVLGVLLLSRSMARHWAESLTAQRITSATEAKIGDLIEVKTLISHVMETGQRKDKDGKTIPRNIINTFTASYNGKPVFKAELQQGISANPYIAFYMKVPGPGEFELTWLDDAGAKVTEKVKLNVV